MRDEHEEGGGTSAVPLSVTPVPHDEIGASALFRSVLAGGDALGFYRWNPWSADDRAQAARVAAESARHREAVADVLAEQNRGWGAGPAVLDLVETLRRPESVAVVTGQQLGLFAGPLYTIYKARTAVRLAARLEAETGRAAVPVFWLADEDHDWGEIHRATFADRGTVRHATYDDGLPPDADRGPVGRVVLDPAATARALAELADALPAGPHRAEALALVRDAYAPGRTMRDAFARLLRALVPDVVLMSADDARLKRLVAPLLAQEVERWPETLAVLEERSDALVAAGFHAQITPTPGNLFWMGEGSRRPLDPQESGFTLRGTAETRTTADLLRRLDDAPETLSPNVVLRPLVQDTLLPTAAYVAGPGEAAYFAQLGPVYSLFGVPMPVIEPRLSLTVVEPSVAKVLDRYGLGVADLGGDLAALLRRLALAASDLDLEPAFAQARAEALGALASLEPLALQASPSLDGAVGAARALIEQALDRLETKTVRVEKQTHDDVRRRLERAQAALWPEGHLQERALGPLGVVARHGVAALTDLVEALPARRSHSLRRPAMTLFSPLVERAIETAAEWHDGTSRKGRWSPPFVVSPDGQPARVPAMAHLATVALTVQRAGWDDETVAAAFLHDALEDPDRYGRRLARAALVERVGESVVVLVEAVSEPQVDDLGERLPWRVRKETYLDQLARAAPQASAISLADKLHNAYAMASSLAAGVDIFTSAPGRKGLSAGPEAQAWFFRAVLDVTRRHDDPRLAPMRDRLAAEIERFERAAGGV